LNNQCPLCGKKKENGTAWWILHLAFCPVANREFNTSKRVITQPESQVIRDEEMPSQTIPDTDVEMRSAATGSSGESDLAERFQKSCSTSTYVPTHSSASTCDSEQIKAQKEEMRREKDIKKLREVEINDDIAQAHDYFAEITSNYVSKFAIQLFKGLVVNVIYGHFHSILFLF